MDDFLLVARENELIGTYTLNPGLGDTQRPKSSTAGCMYRRHVLTISDCIEIKLNSCQCWFHINNIRLCLTAVMLPNGLLLSIKIDAYSYPVTIAALRSYVKSNDAVE